MNKLDDSDSLTPRATTPNLPVFSPSSILLDTSSIPNDPMDNIRSPRFRKSSCSLDSDPQVQGAPSSVQNEAPLSRGSSIHLSLSALSTKPQRGGEEDAITRSILNDISDHDLMYNSRHKPSAVHRIGISLLPDVDMGRKPSGEDSCHASDSQHKKLADLCRQMSTELKHTKEELSKLYRENKSLRTKLTTQDHEIRLMQREYETQNSELFKELQELRSALTKKPEDIFSLPTLDPEDHPSSFPSHRQFCCLPY